MTIPLVDLRAQYLPLEKEILDRIQGVLRGMQLFLGENVQCLEREFADFCGARYGVGTGSGTDALHLALRAVGVGPGDEVITVSHTFVATAEAIVFAGARPVFVDIDPVTMTMDPSLVEAAITPHTRAIIPVHIYGHPADMQPILDVAERCQVSEKTVRRWIDAGDLVAYRLGRQWRVDPEDLQKFLESRRSI